MPRERNSIEIPSEVVTDAREVPPPAKAQQEEDHVDIQLKARFEFKSTQFVDDGKEYCHEHEYDRSSDDQGLVLIFNQETFDDHEFNKRTGSIRDLNNVMTTFMKLGFNIKKRHIYRDQDRSQILKIISMETELLSLDDCKNKNALIVIFMSHGNSQNVLYTRDGQITVDELVDPLAKYFKDKPKLFIIQACKSTKEDMQTNQETYLTFPIYTLPSDVVIYYSTVEGKVAVRNIITGTWVIEEFCKNLLMYGRKEDVLSLLNRTTKCVAILETELLPGEVYKQMPVVVSTLQKKFYLTSNKFRKDIHFTSKGIGEVSLALKNLLLECSKH